MSKVIIVLSFCTLWLQMAIAQNNNISIRGSVFEKGKNIPISGCNVMVYADTKKTGSTTKSNGNFVLNLKQTPVTDSITIRFSHINYHPQVITIVPKQELNIQLKRKIYTIGNVTVHSAYSSNNKGNKFVYTPSQAASSISIIGEPDVVRHISSLPGVAQGIEGTLGLFVRGSNNGSNRIEFNDVPFYSYSHLLGMFSAFSPDVIEKTTFRPGGIPAKSGNLSSSLLQISTKKTLNQSFKGKISLSPYMTGSYLSIPLKKDKLSIQIAGRTSFMPWMINQVAKSQNNEDEQEEVKGQVLDFTSIINWKLNQTNTFDFMFYYSNDYFDFKDNSNQNKMNWSNLAFKTGWVSQLTPQLKLKSTVYYSSTHSAQEQLYFNEWQPTKTTSQLRLGSELDEWSINSVLTYNTNSPFTIKMGFNYQLQQFKPASEKTIYTQNRNTKFNDKQKSNLLTGFIDVNYSKPETIELSLGYRNTFHNTENQNCNNFDIRFLSDIYLTQRLGVELSYDRLTQFYHVLEGLPTGWSLNVTIPSGKFFPEEITNQVYSGLFVKPQLQDFSLHFTLGGYYRHMKNLVSYINTVNMFGIKDATWADEIDTGKGYSYGLELAGAIQGGRFGATLAYTLSKTRRQFPQINKGNSFPFKFDRRHILNLQSKYTILKNTSKKGYKREQVINTVLAYSSGHNTTLPIASYQGIIPPYWNTREQGLSFPDQVNENAYHRQEMTSRNGFKMEDYFRVDLSYTLIKHRPKSTRELSFSIFNILNRQNPYLFFYDDNKWQQLSIAPIMPSLRWTLSF
ncbi:MAG: carboxypeptidase-like regulatory domain-containing protein [Marinifilum sp.]|nr:carboxypeptidase-like regulatory domain-containing protein [Marinifilum sp.]